MLTAGDKTQLMWMGILKVKWCADQKLETYISPHHLSWWLYVQNVLLDYFLSTLKGPIEQSKGRLMSFRSARLLDLKADMENVR